MTASGASERFDKIAQNFATSEVHRSSPSMNILHELLDSQRGRALCEVACGAGHLALSFADQGPARIVGVDPAPSMLAAFQDLASERGQVVETVHAYAENVPLPTESFDLVLSRLAPHHFDDIRAAVAEMARLVRPARPVAIIDLEGDDDEEADAFNHEIELLHDPTHVRSYRADQWVEFFQDAGLSVPIVRRQLAESRTGVTLQRWCEIASSGDKAREEIRHRLDAAPPGVLERLGIWSQDGEYRFPIRTCLIVAVKPAGRN